MDRNIFAYRNIADKFKKILKSRSTFMFYWRTYILSKLKHIQPDIYMVSYPKCGRTWLRVMIQKYNTLMGFENVDYHDRSIIKTGHAINLKFEHDQGNWVPAPPKIEELYFNTKKFGGQKIIFLVRDPRDVLVSSWYHLKYRENIYKGGLRDFVHEDLVGIQKVVTFFNLWMANKDKPAAFKLLTYENLHEKPEEELANILSFAGVAIDKEKVKQAVDESRFDKMKKLEQQGSLDEPWMKPGGKDLQQTVKIRKGKVGGYRKEMDEETIAYVNQYMDKHLDTGLLKIYRQ